MSMVVPTPVVPDNFFKERTDIRSVSLTGVQSIGMSAFKMTCIQGRVVVPDECKSIGSYAFYHCYGITTVVLPPGISLGLQAFGSCTSLTDLTMDITDAACAIEKNVFTESGSSRCETTIVMTGVAASHMSFLSDWHKLADQFKFDVKLLGGQLIRKGFHFTISGNRYWKQIRPSFPCKITMCDLSGDDYSVDWDGTGSFRVAAAAQHKALEEDQKWDIKWGDDVVEEITQRMIRENPQEDIMLVWRADDAGAVH